MDPIVADGYWLMLEPLPRGTHVLRYGGAATNAFAHDLVANIIVVSNYVMPTNALVDGKTLPEWSAEWWQWMHSISTNRLPVLDPDGTDAHEGQPGGNVFFIAGMWSLPQAVSRVTRQFNVPAGKYLFFPLNNFCADNVDTEPPMTVAELQDILDWAVNNIATLYASLDGQPVPVDLFAHRAVSPAFSMVYTNADNLESYLVNHPFTGLNDPMVSDGYWLMLQPLPVGPHVLSFGGSNGPPWNNSIEVTVCLIVEKDPANLVCPTNSMVAGKTVGEWVAAAAQWEYSYSTNANPFLDPDGRWASLGQTGPVFFVPGYDTVRIGLFMRRAYIVPSGRYLLIPLLYAEAENIDTEPPFPENILRDFISGFFMPPPDMHFSIDGVAVSNLLDHREYVPAFSLYFSTADNLKTLNYGHSITGLVDPVVREGYWLMLKPLPPGRHTLRFGSNIPGWPGGGWYDRTDVITVVGNFNGQVERQANGQVQLQFHGLLGRRYQFHASTNLVHWLPLATNVMERFPFQFLDPGAGGFERRFYRALLEP